MRKVAEFVRNCELIKGRKPAPEGTVSKNGKMVKRGGKWVPKAKGRSAKSKTDKTTTSAGSTTKAAVKGVQTQLNAASKAAFGFKFDGDRVRVLHKPTRKWKIIDGSGQSETQIRADVINSMMVMLGLKEDEAAKKIKISRANVSTLPPNAKKAFDWAVKFVSNAGYEKYDLSLSVTKAGGIKVTMNGKSRTVPTKGMLSETYMFQTNIREALDALKNA